MPHLSNISGSALVPDISQGIGSLVGGITKGIQKFQAQERSEQERVLATAAFGDQEPAEEIEPDRSEERSELAMLQLFQINPEFARNIQGMIERRDKRELQEADRLQETGVKRAILIEGIEDPIRQKKAIRDIISEIGASNENPQVKSALTKKWVDIANMTPLNRNLELMKIQTIGTATKTALEGANKKRQLREQQESQGLRNLARDILDQDPRIQTQVLMGVKQRLQQQGRDTREIDSLINAPVEDNITSNRNSLLRQFLTRTRTAEESQAIRAEERADVRGRAKETRAPATPEDRQQASNIIALAQEKQTDSESLAIINNALKNPATPEKVKRILAGTLSHLGQVREDQAVFEEGIEPPSILAQNLERVARRIETPEQQKARLAEPETAFAKPSIKDFTSESIAKFEETGKRADLVPRAGREQALVQVQTFEEEAGKLAARSDATVRDEVRGNARTASRQLGKVRNLSNLLEKAETGTFTQFFPQLARVIPFFDATDEQAAAASINSFVLDQMQAFKGTTSDRELEFARQTVTQLGNTPEANEIVLRSFENVIFLAQQENKQFDRFLKEGGKGRDFIFDFQKVLFPDHPEFGDVTLDDIQTTAFENSITMDKALKELRKR